jgi:porin
MNQSVRVCVSSSAFAVQENAKKTGSGATLLRLSVAVGSLIFLANGAYAADLTLTPQPAAPIDPYAQYQNLRIKGTTLGLPGPADTIDGQADGVRAALAQLGVGYLVASLNTIADNVNPNALRAPNGASQQYNGQRFSPGTQNFVWMTLDLSRYGIPDGQIVAGAVYNDFEWNPSGPNKLGVGTLTYFQTLFDKRIEIKAGLLQNSLEYVAPNIAGSLAVNVFGPAGSIQYQGGLSTFTTTAPGVNVKWNIGDGFYDKFGVQRSVSPDGGVVEINQNPIGLNWTVPNAGALYIDEFGYSRAADTGSTMAFYRGGAAYNTSDWTQLGVAPPTRSDGNSFFYLLGDQQLWQAAPTTGPRRGFYAGFSAMYAPPETNTFTSYYELRLYDIGAIPRRPDDVISLVLTDSLWSNILIDSTIAAGKLAHTDSKSATLSYNAHLSPGVYAGIGVSYVDHPTTVSFTPQTGSALNVLASLNLFF